MEHQPEHLYQYAITMSSTAIQIAANHFYEVWKACTDLAAQEVDMERKSLFENVAAKQASKLYLLCEAVDNAMQLAGDMINECDGADEWGLTDSAYEAMDRAFGRQPD